MAGVPGVKGVAACRGVTGDRGVPGVLAGEVASCRGVIGSRLVVWERRSAELERLPGVGTRREANFWRPGLVG